MRFTDHIKQVIITYPNLFSNAITAYDHLFLTIGNGYEWKNGELVYDGNLCSSKEEAIANLINNIVRRFDYFNYDCQHKDKIISHLIDGAKKDIHTILHVEDLVEDLSIVDPEFKFYSLSKYSAIANIPDDIKIDWLRAIKLFIDLLLSNNDKFKDEDSLINKISDRVSRLYSKKMNEFYDSLEE